MQIFSGHKGGIYVCDSLFNLLALGPLPSLPVPVLRDLARLVLVAGPGDPARCRAAEAAVHAAVRAGLGGLLARRNLYLHHAVHLHCRSRHP